MFNETQLAISEKPIWIIAASRILTIKGVDRSHRNVIGDFKDDNRHGEERFYDQSDSLTTFRGERKGEDREGCHNHARNDDIEEEEELYATNLNVERDITTSYKWKTNDVSYDSIKKVTLSIYNCCPKYESDELYLHFASSRSLKFSAKFFVSSQYSVVYIWAAHQKNMNLLRRDTCLL